MAPRNSEFSDPILRSKFSDLKLNTNDHNDDEIEDNNEYESDQGSIEDNDSQVDSVSEVESGSGDDDGDNDEELDLETKEVLDYELEADLEDLAQRETASILRAPTPEVENEHQEPKNSANKPKKFKYVPCEFGVPSVVNSKFGLPPTIWFEYPNWLGIKRSRENVDITVCDNDSSPILKYKSYWERNCIKDIFRVAGMKKVSSSKNCSLIWGKHLRSFSQLTKNQRCNHFPGSWCLGRKDRISLVMSKKRRDHASAYNFFPECYILPLHRDRLRQRLTSGTRTRLWIRKPVASAQGKGIRVVDNKTVYEMVQKKKKKSSKKNSCVIQKYLSNPMLIDRTKFDIRIYVLVTSFSPLRVYMFPEGLVRFCTSKYSNKNKSNRFGHLTNYSINKKSDNFKHNVNAEDDSDGSKWSLSALLRIQKWSLSALLWYIGKEKGEYYVSHVMNQFRDIVAKTIIAADDDVTTKVHQQVPSAELCFELFGFDLMLDAKLRAWLIEVNVSPSLMTASPLDRKIKCTMMCDLFHTVGIPYPYKASNNMMRNPSARSFESALSNTSAMTNKSSNSRTSNGKISTTTFNKLSQKKNMLKPKRNVRTLRNTSWKSLNAEDKKIVYSVCEEYERKGHFERVFPPESKELYAHYLSLFSAERYSNVLIQQFEKQAREDMYRYQGRAVKVQPIKKHSSKDLNIRKFTSFQQNRGGIIPSSHLAR